MPNLQPPGGAMRISVGIDIAKEIHWVTAIDADGAVQIDRKLPNTPADIATLSDELTALRGTVRIGLDVIGGIAGLAQAMLAEAGFALVHVPGIAVNRARQGTVGGENKSDPRDARTIADHPVGPAPDRAGHRTRPRHQTARQPSRRHRAGANPTPVPHARPARRRLSGPGSLPRPQGQRAAAPADQVRHASRVARRRQEAP